MSAPRPLETTPAARLRSLDAMFLALEDDRQPMHVALTVIVEGTLDRERLAARLDDVTRHVPKLRQRATRTESRERAAWEDDPHFDLANHVRFETLPTPGTERMLQTRVARFHAERIDRERPLWSALVVDGLENDRTALVVKVHHAVLDGIAGFRVLGRFFDEAKVPRPHRREQATAPSAARVPSRFAGLRASAASGIRGLAKLLRIAARRPPRSVLTQLEHSATRAFAWTSVDLEMLETLGREAGGTVNDAMLAVIAGGLRLWLIARGDSPPHAAMRVVVPVSLHTQDDRSAGNQIAVLFVPLPVDDEDPERRLARVIAATRRAKGSRQVEGIAWGEQLADRTRVDVLGAVVRTALRFRLYDLIVTNVPGPTEPMSLLGARVVALYPLVPLVGHQAVGIALASYAGRMYVGINIDDEHIDDGDVLVRAIEESFVRQRSSRRFTSEREWPDDRSR